MKTSNWYAIFYFLLAFFLIFFAILPKQQEVKYLAQIQKELKESLKNKERYFEEIKDLAQKLEEKKEVLTKIDLALPKEPEITEFLNFIEGKIAENKLFLKRINLSPSSPIQEKLKETKINLTVIGEYSDIKAFLGSLETSARLPKINLLSLTPLQTEGGKNLVEGNIEVKVYSY
jgi:Tfp pilus assembly protein PilO